MREKQRWRGLLKRNTPIYEEGNVQRYFPLIAGCDVDMKTCWVVILIPRFNDDNERDYRTSDVGDMLVANSPEGYGKLIKWTNEILELLPEEFAEPYIKREKLIPFVAESTGPYTQTFFRLMDGTDSPFISFMINAGMQDKRGKRNKTDKGDALDMGAVPFLRRKNRTYLVDILIFGSIISVKFLFKVEVPIVFPIITLTY
jgi:hypothetical protein